MEQKKDKKPDLSMGQNGENLTSKDNQSVVIENIKMKPINQKKLLRRTMITAGLAVLFGLIACLTFIFLEPFISNLLNPKTETRVITFPEDIEEMDPEDMIAESVSEEEIEPSSEVVLEQHQIDEIIDSVTLTKDNYKQLYSSMSSYVSELNQYVLTVIEVSEEGDLLSDLSNYDNQVSGVVIQDNGREVLILASAEDLNTSSQLMVSFYNNVIFEANIKKIDPETNLCVLAISLSDFESQFGEGEYEYPTLANYYTSRLNGTPVVSLGSTTGIPESIGYGMIVSSSEIYNVADRNYRMLQTDISGSSQATGVLFNMEGHIIGVTTKNHTSSDMDNVIYAYGIADLKRLLEKLCNGYDIPYMGVHGVGVSTSMSSYYSVPVGVLVQKIDMESPAMLAGIQQGDVIISFGETNVTSFYDYTSALMKSNPGDTIDVTVMRESNEEYREVNFTIEIGAVN